MNAIPQDKLLKFNPDTLVSVRKLYNFDGPGQINEAINILDDWVKKQNHFTKKDYSRDYLERLIIFAKGSVERAKSQMEKICTMKTLFKHYFDKHNPREDFKNLKGSYAHAIVQELTEDDCRIIITKLYPTTHTTQVQFDCGKLGGLFAEYIRAHDYCSAFISIIDIREINIAELLSMINLVYLNTLKSIYMSGYGFRIRNIHILTSSNSLDNLMIIAKKLMGLKLFGKVIIHKNLETLHEYISKGFLPAEYGGRGKSLNMLCDEWLEHLSTQENVEYSRNIMTQHLVIESCRDTAKFNEHSMGINGTFRTLNLD